MISLEAYRQVLRAGGPLKLKATALLALGGDDERFEACVLFHEAARAEARALGLLDQPSSETRLSTAVERCWCYVEGLDPVAAAQTWGEIVLLEPEMSRAAFSAATERIGRRYPAELKGFRQVWLRLQQLVRGGSLLPPAKTRFAEYERAARSFATEYPGVPHAWWWLFRLAEYALRLGDAWSHIQCAHRLAPENAVFSGLRIWTAARALKPSEADKYLCVARAQVQSAALAVCQFHAFSEIYRARGSAGRDRVERLDWAANAAQEGLSRSQCDDKSGRYLRAVLRIVEALRGGRRPGLEILYEVGLGSLVAASPEPDRDDVFTLLTATAQREVEPATMLAA